MTSASMLFLVLLTMVVPALPAGWALARAMRGGWAAAFIVSLTISLAIAAVSSTVGWLAGLSLGWSVAIQTGLVVVIDVWAVWRARGLRRLPYRRDVPYFVTSAIVAVLAIWERAWMAPNMDVFYHIAAARSTLLFDSAMVTDPFYGVGSHLPDPTSGALTSLLGMASWVTRVDPAALWTGLNVLAALAAPAAYWMLFRQLRASRRGAVAGLLAVTFLATSSDFRFAAYPNQLGVILMVTAIAGLAAAVRGRRSGWAVAVLGAVAASATHTGVALTMMVMTAIIAVGMEVYAWWSVTDSEHRRHLRHRVRVAASTMLLGALLAVAPRLWFLAGASDAGVYSPASASGVATAGLYRLFGVGLLYDPEVAFHGGAITVVLGTALAVLALFSAFRRRADLVAVGSLTALVPLLIGFNPLLTPFLAAISPYVTWRMLTLMGFAPYVALPLMWEEQRLLTRLTIIAAIVTTLPALHMQFSGEPPVSIRQGVINVSIWDGWKHDFRAGDYSAAIGDLGKEFGDDWPTVATTPITGYDLGGLIPCNPVAVTEVHAPLFMERTGEGAVRRHDMNVLFDETTAPAVRRWIVQKWDVDYVVWWPEGMSKETRAELVADTETFELIYDRYGVILFKVLIEPGVAPGS